MMIMIMMMMILWLVTRCLNGRMDRNLVNKLFFSRTSGSKVAFSFDKNFNNAQLN